MLDTPIKPGFLHESGVMLGAGAVIVMDDSMDALSVVRNLAQYNANESCGKCTPCREGTPRMVEMIDPLIASCERMLSGGPNGLSEAEVNFQQSLLAVLFEQQYVAVLSAVKSQAEHGGKRVTQTTHLPVTGAKLQVKIERITEPVARAPS